jgi:SAM-dependent methyltransferase
MNGKHRAMEQLKEHYEIEKALANKLRNASRKERLPLYALLYDELYKSVPLHPQLIGKASPRERQLAVSREMKFIKRFLAKGITFLEFGPGDCALSFEVAKHVKQVYAVDVSDEISQCSTWPGNFRLILSDGGNIPLASNSIDIAYSNQLMEHLHPDDALEQLKNIYAVLIPGGMYICITPNRLSGPHDISKHFDEVATGFHLKEYTTSELSNLFRGVGFSRVKTYIGAKGNYFKFPSCTISLCETLIDQFRYPLRKTIARMMPFRGIRLVGIK